MKSGLLIGVGLIIGSTLGQITYAQVIEPIVFDNEEVKTPADFKYTSTSTPAIYLEDDQLIILKEEYNNTKEITDRLDMMIVLLRKIERNSR